MATKISRKHLFVTGASRGIGKALVTLALKENYHVTCIARSKAPKEYSRDNSDLLYIQGDVANYEFLKRSFKQALDRFGPIDVLVQNAAVLSNKRLIEEDHSKIEQMFAINSLAPIYGAKIFMETRKKAPQPRKGLIINIASLGGVSGTDKFAGFATYSSTKGAMVILSECLAVEGRELGVSSIAIAPGAVNTDMLKLASPSLKSNTEALDVAKFILSLMKNPSIDLMTGSVIPLYTNVS